MISFCCPSRGRPLLAKRLVDTATATQKGKTEFLFYLNDDDRYLEQYRDLLDEKHCQSFLRDAILKNYIISSHDVSDGGLALALSECCILSSKGATIELESKNFREDNLLFSEGGSRIIFSLNQKKEANFLNFINDKSVNFGKNIYVKKIGFVSKGNLIISNNNQELCDIKVADLTKKFNNSISSHIY